jgi:hypothetical protein
LNVELKNVEEPIKKLLEDKSAIENKLNQKMLDKCSKFFAKKNNKDV